MRPKSCMFVLVLFVFAVSTAFAGGNARVAGPVSGHWVSGDNITVEGPIWVPADGSLLVDSGVVIVFEVTEPFFVYGSFDALGTPNLPILISTPAEWQGIHFMPMSIANPRVLRYVVIDISSGLPDSVIVSNLCAVEMFGCDLRANMSCLRAHGGRILAEENSFTTYGFLSTAVLLDSLFNTPNLAGNYCEASGVNRFARNMVIASVPMGPGPFPRLLHTCGLQVSQVNTICLTENVVTVIAPGKAIGVLFDRITPGDTGPAVWEMGRGTVVTVRSHNWQPWGVYLANEGTLNLDQCTIDVSRVTLNPTMACGVAASGTASVVVTSCNVVIDAGDMIFGSLSGGLISADYDVIWRTTGNMEGNSTPPVGGNLGQYSGTKEISPNINLGDNIVFADPQFAMGIAWGTWTTRDDVELYYGILPSSPCINAGDTTRCPPDPDGTLPDVGAFPYYHTPNSADPIPVALPESVELSAPYPNPFNSSAVIPFSIENASVIRMSLYDILGREVAVLASGQFLAGSHRVLYNPENLSTGVYFVTVNLNGIPLASRPLVHLK